MKKQIVRIVVGKLRKRFSQTTNQFGGEDEFRASSKALANDVKEGHFAVLAMKGSDENNKRFVVKIECLNNPKFLSLLEKAEEEYGFEQSGVLMLPCTPQELWDILE